MWILSFSKNRGMERATYCIHEQCMLRVMMLLVNAESNKRESVGEREKKADGSFWVQRGEEEE